MANLQKQIAALIRSRRQAAGISQEALADEAKLHRTYISLLERGLRMPSMLVFQQLARGLGTTMTSLVQELERKSNS